MSLRFIKLQQKKMAAMLKPLSPSGILQQSNNQKITDAFGNEQKNAFVEQTMVKGYSEKIDNGDGTFTIKSGGKPLPNGKYGIAFGGTAWMLDAPICGVKDICDVVINNIGITRKTVTISLEDKNRQYLDTQKNIFFISGNFNLKGSADYWKVSNFITNTAYNNVSTGSVEIEKRDLSIAVHNSGNKIEISDSTITSIQNLKDKLKNCILIGEAITPTEEKTLFQNPTIKSGNSILVATDDYKNLDATIQYWSRTYQELSAPVITKDNDGNIVSDIVENAKDSNLVTCKIDRKNHKAIY